VIRRLLALIAAAAMILAAHVVTSVGAGAAVVTIYPTLANASEWRNDQPLFILLLGSDLRAGAGCGCSDAIQLVGVSPGGAQATILSIPRDTRVAIPGRGTRKINDALALGGPQLAADTVSQFVGVPVAYTMVVGFDAFPALVDEIGGITVDIPTPMNDRATGAVFGTGLHRLDGAQAMAFVRTRKSLPNGDLGRTQNQALLIASALGELRPSTSDPVGTMRRLVTLSRHVDTNGVSTLELYRLGRLAIAIDPTLIRQITLPSTGATIGGTSYVVVTGQAASVFADLADDAILQAN
jgi:polyisoprenyl-teichoic acid--peptidoglycan teichoic acid transferase